MAVTSAPQPADRLRLTWTDDPPGSLDLHRYDRYAHVGKVLELSGAFTEFALEGRLYRVVKVTHRTPLTHDVTVTDVCIELEPVAA